MSATDTKRSSATKDQDCWFVVKCHCGSVQGRFRCNPSKGITAWKCDCSDCNMRQNTHIIVPASSGFQLDMPSAKSTSSVSDSNDGDGDALDDKEITAAAAHHAEQVALYESATTLYQWGTKTAVRRFCRTCGILPWYQPRSNPDGFGITMHCVDWSGNGKPGSTPLPDFVRVETFDGQNWERTMEDMRDGKRKVNILTQSK